MAKFCYFHIRLLWTISNFENSFRTLCNSSSYFFFSKQQVYLWKRGKKQKKTKKQYKS